MAEFGGHRQPHFTGLPRRSTSHTRYDNEPANGLLARAQEYDRALQESMAKVTARKRSLGRSRTRAREDTDQTPVQSFSLSKVRVEDRAPDGGVGSELGDSYVEDISMRKAGKAFLPVASEREEDDKLEDGGIIGLLGQIYGQSRRGL